MANLEKYDYRNQKAESSRGPVMPVLEPLSSSEDFR
jgi:hypothetical protein